MLLQQFDNGDSHPDSDIVPSDEIWTNQYDTERKLKAPIWIFANNTPHVRVISPRSVQKKMVKVFM
jgi:hypothetical protein